MTKFVFLIILCFSGTFSFASDNVTASSITERLKKLSQEKNAMILFPNEPFGINIGMPLNGEVIREYNAVGLDGAQLIQVMPWKRNAMFSKYWAAVSEHNDRVFGVTAVSAAVYTSMNKCLPNRDALFNPLFRKYKFGSKEMQNSKGRAFATKGRNNGKPAHLTVTIECIEDDMGKLRLQVSYIDMILYHESREAYKISLEPDVSNM